MKLFKRTRQAAWVVLLAALVGAWIVSAQNSGDALERGFQNPPDSAKPRVWWHWMNGNITKEGIKADLEWMKRVGIGGFQNFDAALNTPQVVEKRLVYMTPEWKDAFKYAATLADQLGLEMAIAGSPGWSESGGPWVPPAQAMKKFVWSETRVEGGQPFTGSAAQTAFHHGTVSEHCRRASRRVRRRHPASAPSGVLRRQRGDRLSRAGRRSVDVGIAAEGDLQRRPVRARRADRWRPRQVHPSAGSAGRPEVVDPVRIRRPADGSRAHPRDGGRRTRSDEAAAEPAEPSWNRATTARNFAPLLRFRPGRAPSLFRPSQPASSA